MFVIDLLKRLFGSPFQLEFHHVNEVIGLQNKVNSSLWSMIFSFYIETDQFEYDKEYVLIVQFQVTYQFVWCISKETLQTMEEGVIIT